MKKKSIFSASNLLLVFFVAVFIFAASKLLLIYLDYHKADSEYAQIETKYVQPEAPADTGGDTGEESMEIPFRVDFDALAAENPDTVGWVYVGACDISYPIVLGEDNEYYLHNTFEKQANNAGAIFMDFENSPDFTDFNTFVYGHNMKNGSMFGKLKKFYQEENLWGENPFFYIYLKDGIVKKYTIFSYYITTDDSDSYIQALSEEALELYVEKVRSRSARTVDISGFDSGTPIVTLSTCSGPAGGNKRLLVHGILTEEGHQ